MADSRNPFLGFQPYGRSDRLFGRDEDLALLQSRLLSCRTTLLFAGSGVGKTSFLNSKVRPELGKLYDTYYHNRWQSGTSPVPGVAATLRGGEETQAGMAAPIGGAGEMPAGMAGTQGCGPETQAGVLLRILLGKAKNRVLLILDQFEEVFQYYRDTKELASFVEELARLVRTRELDVRLLFSLREEFLGELGVFDNPIPDLFNNYYRLKKPDSDAARDIIELTAKTVGRTSCDDTGLDRLMEDLRRVHFSEQETNNVPRSHVEPPYLQIVCRRVWEREQPGTNGILFLSTYASGEVKKQLTQYTDEKLAALTIRQRIFAANVLDHLITFHGAKKAYSAAQLADLIGLKYRYQREALNDALQRLESVEVLRSAESSGVRSFELYHDMYAPMLQDWRERIHNELTTHDLRAGRLDMEEWEDSQERLDGFWVYLPNFLVNPQPSDPFFTIMLKNFERFRTEYVYILRAQEELVKLWRVVTKFETEIARNGSAGTFSARSLVKVVVLGVSGGTEKASVISRLLHLNNYWIANPDSDEPAGFEVVWDDSGDKIRGGRPLPVGKVRQIIRALNDLFEFYPPRTLEGISEEADLEEWLLDTPLCQLRLEDSAADGTT